MRKMVAFILLFSLLLSNTEAHEALMLPSLFAHFHEHNTKHEPIDWGEFLYIHYVDHESHGEKDDHDDTLPFKGNHYMMSVVAPDMVYDVTYQQNTPTSSCKIPYPYHFNISSYSGNIWQPPKNL